MKRRLCVIAALLVFCGNRSAVAIDLFSEDFEGLPLLDVVTFGSELRGRNVWTDVPPAGWTADNTQVATFGNPNSGVVEFEGWRFVDKDWWTATAGDQRRSEFVNASGIIAVADPDEWDDFGTPSPSSLGEFDARLKTPAISLAGAQANEAKVFFHSSWRPEDTQKASLTAHFNDPGQTSIELLRWESEPTLDDPGNSPNPFFKGDAPNEGLTLNLMNPAGASNVELEFRVFEATNDWWWAFDNINVFTGDGPSADGALRAQVNRNTGNVQIVNLTGESVQLRGYTIVSSSGAILEENATFLSPIDGWLSVVDFTDGVYELSQVNLDSVSLEDGGSIDFGDDVWSKFYRDSSDFTFEYLVEGSDEPQRGIIQFTPESQASYNFLDLNYNGDVEIGDYLTFQNGFGSDLTGLPEARRHNLGDLDNDGAHTHLDFIEFELRYNAVNGPGAFRTDLASIPEPMSLFLIIPGMVMLFRVARRKRWSGTACIVLLLAVGNAYYVSPSHAQLTLFAENFEGIELGSNIEEGDPIQEVWSDTPPPGWNITNDIPGDIDNPAENGVREWYGWSFADKNWWINVAGDQDRSQFTRGSGTVMIADGDEWDDADGPARQAIALASSPTDFYDTFISTPSISIPAGIPAGRIQLSFDSSWRDEAFDDLDLTNNQTAAINVSYGGGSPVEVLRWDSDTESSFFKNDAPNERVVVDLQYDGQATELQLEFFYGNAWNDWWWAIDNVLVSVDPDPSILVIDPNNGNGFLEGGDVIPVDIKSLDIQSGNGVLSPTTYGGLTAANPNQVDGPDNGDIAGDSPGEQWEMFTSSENRFFEGFLFGSTPFSVNNSVFLGQVFDPSTDPADRDVTFSYSTLTGDIIEGVVIFEPRDPVGAECDFNGDGNCNLQDINSIYAQLGGSNPTFDLDGNGVVDDSDISEWLSGASAEDPLGRTFVRGDADLDGMVGGSDFTTFASNFGSTGVWSDGNFVVDAVAGGGSIGGPDFTSLASNFGFASLVAVPESHSLSYAWVAVLVGVHFFRARRHAGALCGKRACERRINSMARHLIRPMTGLALAALLLASWATPPAQAQLPPSPWLDRDYQMGDDPTELPSAGGLVPNFGTGTKDSAGEFGMNQRIGMLANSRVNPALRPKYVNVTDRPDGVTGFGIQMNPLGGVERAYLHTGFTEALNFPERSPSSTFSPGGTIDYSFINDRGFELWTKPTVVQPSHIVMDTNQHGVLIDANTQFAMRYAGIDYATNITPMANEWFHLSVVRPFGPNSGSIFYVNGVAEAAARGQYRIEQVVNEDTPSSNIADLDTSPLVVGASTGADHGLSQYYSGIVDDLEMFVMGLNGTSSGYNSSGDFGEYIFARDNGYAAAFAPTLDGDIVDDGDPMTPPVVDIEDALAFATNWQFTKTLEWTTPTGQAQSLIVGDLESRGFGDFNYDGRVNLADWAVLNNANPVAGAVALDLIMNVPEPSGLALLFGALLPLTRRLRHGRRTIR